MIAGHRVRHRYGDAVVVDGVDIAVPARRTVGLVGPNGSGKTTLLRALYGSLQPTEGRIELDGRDLADVPRRDLARAIAVVVQEHSGDLPMRVTDLVLLGRLPHQGLSGRPSAHDQEVATDALRQVGALHLATREYAGLSGGEKQRVLIARALAQEAEHLLLDEPTNHLDIRYQHEVLDLVARLPASVVVVLHDLNLAARYCDHVVVLGAGRVVAQGPPDEVLVPEVLEPVYEVQVRRVDHDGDINLVFRKATTTRSSA
ncbi:ABC transporter ATP-binding protein [Nocardioides sp. ChNu-99]|uniref:ABC transporter ATP-binding protein n=1 Tax=Nocardioides sp. ChNu-99 TaxID=2839897 RepID=UPI002405BBDA|nr:ABC transporter ATP-binding protein [Nocardioides sp. ChNu-99]MDF9716435.1 ABC transporter ATP-binding protein [Nocardioides sp. ChNu-99]